MYIVKRDSQNPILSPSNGRPWEVRGTFNGCPVKRGKDIFLLYRALGDTPDMENRRDLSTIGSALSQNGGPFQSRMQFIAPEHDWERFGCEDPRVTYFEGKYVIFYTALGGYPFGPHNIKVGMALSKDMQSVSEKHLITPFNAKAMALFPSRINGKITAVLSVHTDEPPTHMAIVQCDRLEDLYNEAFWETWHADLPKHIINPLRFEHDHVEVGAPPIKTKDGWLMVYSYIHHYFGGGKKIFGIEALLLDLKDPRKIVGHTNGPIIVPEASYELYGQVPDIIFPTGALVEGKRLDIYYGGADTICARASLNLPDLLDAMIPSRRKALGIRNKKNPIISPIPEHPWENKATFNAGVIELEGTIHLLYRALSQDNVSTFGYATSKDGFTIKERLPEPAYVPRAPFEKKNGPSDINSGCEDPRLTKIGDRIYAAYTAFDGTHPWHVTLSSIAVKDFLARRFDKWSMPQIVTPDSIKDKDGCVFPEKIDGKYLMLHRLDAEGAICADLLPSLDFSTQRLTRCIDVMAPRGGMWDSAKIGIAGTPIKTDLGWLLIYHGVSKTGTYRLGAALLDLKDPTILLSRTVDPIFEPVEKYEIEGQVRKVVFSCGMVARKDTLFIYYGGGDSTTSVAKFSIKKLLAILAPASLS